jgi:hypothetical protein
MMACSIFVRVVPILLLLLLNAGCNGLGQLSFEHSPKYDSNDIVIKLLACQLQFRQYVDSNGNKTTLARFVCPPGYLNH